MIPSVALAADADRAVVDMMLNGIFRFTHMASYVKRKVNVIHTGALAAHADRASIGMTMPLSHTYEAPSFTSLTSKMGTQ